MKTTRLILFVAVAVAVAGFGASETRAAAPTEFEVGGIRFERPDNWGWVVPASPMRKAQLTPPGGDGIEACEVTFFFFGPDQGGTVEQNIDRWVGQFEGTPESLGAMRRDEMAGDIRVHFVTARGTFNSGMPGGSTTPLENYALLGAILEGPEGNVFVKMTGPAPVVDAAAETFQAFVSSAARGGGTGE